VPSGSRRLGFIAGIAFARQANRIGVDGQRRRTHAETGDWNEYRTATVCPRLIITGDQFHVDFAVEAEAEAAVTSAAAGIHQRLLRNGAKLNPDH